MTIILILLCCLFLLKQHYILRIPVRYWIKGANKAANHIKLFFRKICKDEINNIEKSVKD